MLCALVRWWLEEYIDGTLTGSRLRLVHAHLRTCPSCSRELSWRRSLAESLRMTITTPPSQEMWRDFQQRLAQRPAPAGARRLAWWQWGSATAAVACALVLSLVYWGRQPAESPMPVLPRAADVQDNTEQQVAMRAAPPETKPASECVGRAVSAAPGGAKRTALPAQSEVPPRLRAALAGRPTVPFAESVVVASVAYAEVRNASGELVGKVLLQTTYDENGQPKAVQIEFDSPAVVEVDANEQPADAMGDNNGASGASADSPMPATGARMGIPD